MRPIASSEAISPCLGSLLEKAFDLTDDDAAEISVPNWDALDAQHYNLWSDAREKHRKRTQELAEFRRESLSTSHQARIALLEEQLRQASNEKIQKMRQSQITTAEADFARRIQDLDIAMERADVIAEPVAYGVIQIVGDAAHAE